MTALPLNSSRGPSPSPSDATPPQMPEPWQPMKTAQKDGTKIILRGKYHAVVAWWGDLNAPDSEFGTVEHEPRWCWLGEGDCKQGPVFLRMEYLEPICWMPIPPLGGLVAPPNVDDASGMQKAKEQGR